MARVAPVDADLTISFALEKAISLSKDQYLLEFPGSESTLSSIYGPLPSFPKRTRDAGMSSQVAVAKDI